MTLLGTIAKGIVAVVLIVLLVTVLMAISAAIGGLVGYAIAWVYVNWLGYTIGFSLVDAALLGSIVGVLGGSSAAASGSQ